MLNEVTNIVFDSSRDDQTIEARIRGQYCTATLSCACTCPKYPPLQTKKIKESLWREAKSQGLLVYNFTKGFSNSLLFLFLFYKLLKKEKEKTLINK